MARLAHIALVLLFVNIEAHKFSSFSEHVHDDKGLDRLLKFDDPELLTNYSRHLQKHGKKLQDVDEVIKRAGIFKANQELVKENQKKEKGNGRHSCGKFCDVTKEEFLKTSTGFHSSTTNFTRKAPQNKIPTHHPKHSGLRAKRDSIPDEFDWRDYGIVSSVKDQGSCGSCVSHTTAAVTEAVYSLWYGVTPGDYSEEELVDCAPGNHCDGTSFDKTFPYIQSKKGIVSEKTYPYSATGSHTKCGVKSNAARQANIDNYWTLDSEDDIAENLYWYGPVAVAIDASQLQSYDGGILWIDEPSEGWSINHAVTIVGYGVDDGYGYWIIKNSWSSGWGESGYFRMYRGYNMLNVQHEPVLCTVA